MSRDGRYMGRHYTEWVEDIKRLKRDGRRDDALVALAGCRAAALAQARADGWDRPAPYYWDEAAKLLAQLGRFDEAIDLLRDYESHVGAGPYRTAAIASVEAQIRRLEVRRDKAAAKASPPVCPSCGVLLKSMPARSRECPDCGEMIVRRTIDGKPVLLTPVGDEQRSAALHDQREVLHLLDLAARAGIDETTWEQHRAELAERWHREPPRRDVLWAALNQRTLDLASGGDWDGVANVHQIQAIVLHEEGRDWTQSAEHTVVARLRIAAKQLDPSEPMESVGCGCPACSGGRIVGRLEDLVREPRLPHAACEAAPCTCWFVPVRGHDAYQNTVRLTAVIEVPELQMSEKRGLLGRFRRR